MPRTGKYGRLRQLVEILLHDKVTFTEMLSGLALVALRGGLLVGLSKFVSEGSAVAHLLLTVGITEARWAWYLMLCGLLQVWFAGGRPESQHLGARVLVTFLILLGFAAMGCAFYVALGAREVPPSIICMCAFYIVLLARVGEEWWESLHGHS